jgi:hypothetical protein
LWDQAIKAEDLGFCSRLGAATDVPMCVYTAQEAAAVVDIIEVYQKRFQAEHDCALVYPSDEFYLLCDRPMPPAERYDGMPQYSNGVGMTRDFLDGWTKAQAGRALLRRQPEQQGKDDKNGQPDRIRLRPHAWQDCLRRLCISHLILLVFSK